MKRFLLLLIIMVAGPGSVLIAQTKSQPEKTKHELTGNLSFDILSMSGKVTSFLVRVGDGGTGPWKAVMTNGATQNVEDDFKWIDQVPVMVAKYDFSDRIKETGNKGIGHYPATYRNPNGGDFAVAALAWLKWQLKGDQEAARMFRGDPCGLVKNSKWTVNKKNID